MFHRSLHSDINKIHDQFSSFKNMIKYSTQCNFSNILKSFKYMYTWLRKVKFPFLSPITFNVQSKTILTVKTTVLFEQQSREFYSCVKANLFQ